MSLHNKEKKRDQRNKRWLEKKTPNNNIDTRRIEECNNTLQGTQREQQKKGTKQKQQSK